MTEASQPMHCGAARELGRSGAGADALRAEAVYHGSGAPTLVPWLALSVQHS